MTRPAILVVLVVAGCDAGFGPSFPPADASDAEDATIAPGFHTPMDFAAAVRRDLYVKDLEFIASAPRQDCPHWQEVHDFCASRLASFGFVVERHLRGPFVSVVGAKPGGLWPEETVVIGAHYDSVSGCPAADDNATGVAGVLEAARVLSLSSFERTLIVACWDGEEVGAVGSGAWLAEAVSQGMDIQAALNLDMIGFTCHETGCQKLWAGFDESYPSAAMAIHSNYDRGDFLAVSYNTPAASLATAAELAGAALGLRTILMLRPKFDSNPTGGDHVPFWHAGLPAMNLWDMWGRNPNVHCSSGQDSIGTLDLAFATSAVGLAVAVTAAALDPDHP
jgi:hypothetical protein